MTRSASGPLLALLNGSADFQMADLWTITLASGTVIRWSGAMVPLSWGGNSYPLGPPIERTKIKHTRGVQTATLEVDLFPGPSG